jgi:hypothetical protein
VHAGYRQRGLRGPASKGATVDWGLLEHQMTALGDAVGDGTRHADEAAERARRALARLDALERLLGADLPAVVHRGRPQRASLHRSPLADLFRDTERVRRPD